jgi:hypothetical protein
MYGAFSFAPPSATAKELAPEQRNHSLHLALKCEQVFSGFQRAARTSQIFTRAEL